MKKLIITAIALLITNMSMGKVLLKDIGVIGLLSHDLFTWDKDRELNTENGRLDLSTIFDYENGQRWKKGGNPKNAENSPVWTITKSLVEFQKEELKKNGNDFKAARLKTVERFHQLIKESYERLTQLSFPTTAIDQDVNNTEQAALRALHDILPGRVNTYRGNLFPFKSFDLTNFLLAKFTLNKRELNQKIKYFDGDYDSEYKNIKIPFSRKKINLKTIDEKFIENFSAYNQKDMLSELRRVGEGKIKISEVSFINHVQELVQKGLCSNGNEWINSNLTCY